MQNQTDIRTDYVGATLTNDSNTLSTLLKEHAATFRNEVSKRMQIEDTIHSLYMPIAKRRQVSKKIASYYDTHKLIKSPIAE